MTTYTATPAAMHSGHDIRNARGHMVAIVHNPAPQLPKSHGLALICQVSRDPRLVDRLLFALPFVLRSIAGSTGAQSRGDLSNCLLLLEAFAPQLTDVEGVVQVVHQAAHTISLLGLAHVADAALEALGQQAVSARVGVA